MPQMKTGAGEKCRMINVEVFFLRFTNKEKQECPFSTCTDFLQVPTVTGFEKRITCIFDHTPSLQD